LRGKERDQLEKDFYNCYSLKFRIRNGTSISVSQIYHDFGAFGKVVDVWGAGFVKNDANKYNDRSDTEVHVRFSRPDDAKEALDCLRDAYDELTPAISDVLPDNHGTFTISFDNYLPIPTNDLFHEFSKYGEIKSITGDLEVHRGKIFVSYWNKQSAIKAFLGKTERWFVNMRFTLPRCEKDYYDTYCMKFYNTQGSPSYRTEGEIRQEFGQYGEVVDVRGPGLFETGGDDVYVRFWQKTSAQSALSSLVGRYPSLCITPGTDIRPDGVGMYTLTFVNKDIHSEQEIRTIFQKFGPLVAVTGVWGVRTGRVFLSYGEKEYALRALRAMLVSGQFHLQLARSCKPERFAKSVTNYYSAATKWRTSEFPRKRKMRGEEDWFLRREESARGEEGKKRKTDVSDNKREKNEDEAEASYNYRAPYPLARRNR